MPMLTLQTDQDFVDALILEQLLLNRRKIKQPETA